MASGMMGVKLRTALAVVLAMGALSLAGCGPSARERDLSERLAAAEARAQAADRKLAALQSSDNQPNTAPAPNVQDDADAANNADDGNDDTSSNYGDMPDSGPNAGADSPNDFPAPADPPMAGEIRPQDAPQEQR